MGLIDSHCHLTSDALAADLPGVLDRAAQAGVARMISIGVDMDDARRVLELCRWYPNVSGTVGVHPHEAGHATDATWPEYRELARQPGIVALGEMGLDYHYDFSDRPSQKAVFSKQLEIAFEIGLPIVIHSREAMDDTVAMLRDHGFTHRRVVFHCFSGNVAEADVLAENGWRISFTGVVTFKKSVELHQIAKSYPLDQLMLETDSPYLSPEPVRHLRPNEPANTRHIAEFVAKLRGMELPELVEVSAAATRNFFNLP